MGNTPKRSPLAPDHFPVMPDVPGVKIGAIEAGLRYKGRKDLTLAVLAEGTEVAGVFTRSRTASAAVDWCRDKIAAGASGRALVVNAGNANAFTGEQGVSAVEETARIASKVAGCAPDEVFQASTGVIGEPMDTAPFTDALNDLNGDLADCDWLNAAEAISTTDTFPKGSAARVRIGEDEVVIAGIAKGSGMIAPDMATMLSFIFTDAAIKRDALQTLLKDAVEASFNSITVDSDTSTSDTVLLFATGQSGDTVTDVDDPQLAEFRAALSELCLDLAHQIVRDGEGATKFVTVTLTGAETDDAAKRIAFAVANSPLVKTAIAGEDANWGRIVMAVGKSGEAADRDALVIKIGEEVVTERGMLRPGYEEARASAHMQGDAVHLSIDVGVGNGRATVWTCDLTHGYITINGDYRS